MIDWFNMYSLYFSSLFQGLGLTLSLMVLALLIGLIIAIILAISALRWAWMARLVQGFVFFFRGTPLLVQIFLVYYGAAEFAWIRDSIFWVVLREPFGCAVIALSLNSAAYTTVLLKGALQAVPTTEIEAGKALGMSWGLIMRRIIFPHAVITMWPAYSNEPILILKATALVSTITLLDLMGVTQQLITQTYEPMIWLLIAGVIYSLLTGLIVLFSKFIEQRFAKYGGM